MSVKSPDAIDIEVGRRIRIERLAKGVSQTVLAETLGVTFQQVQKYEKGVNRCGPGRLTRIAQRLNVPLAALLPGADPSNENRVAHALALPHASDLLEAFGEIADRQDRRLLLEMAQSLAAKPAALSKAA